MDHILASAAAVEATFPDKSFGRPAAYAKTSLGFSDSISLLTIMTDAKLSGCIYFVGVDEGTEFGGLIVRQHFSIPSTAGRGLVSGSEISTSKASNS